MGVTANQVTLTAAILSFATGAAVAHFLNRQVLFLLPVALFLRMALNAIDGMLAREHNQKTALGAILNELGDVFSDSALYLPLGLLPEFSDKWMTVIVLLAVITEMTGVVSTQIGASRRYDGPMGKSDRAFVFGTLALLLALKLPIVALVRPVEILVAILLVWTIVNRAKGALQEVRQHTQP